MRARVRTWCCKSHNDLALILLMLIMLFSNKNSNKTLKELRMNFIKKRVAEEDQAAAPLPTPISNDDSLNRAFKM